MKKKEETHTHNTTTCRDTKNNGITKHEKTSKIQKKKNPNLTRSKLTTKKERMKIRK